MEKVKKAYLTKLCALEERNLALVAQNVSRYFRSDFTV